MRNIRYFLYSKNSIRKIQHIKPFNENIYICIGYNVDRYLLLVNIEDLHEKSHTKVEGKNEHESTFTIKSLDEFINLL